MGGGRPIPGAPSRFDATPPLAAWDDSGPHGVRGRPTLGEFLMAMIEVEDLRKNYGSFRALR